MAVSQPERRDNMKLSKISIDTKHLNPDRVHMFKRLMHGETKAVFQEEKEKVSFYLSAFQTMVADARKFNDLKSACVAFVHALDELAFVLGDSDLLEIAADACKRRGYTNPRILRLKWGLAFGDPELQTDTRTVRLQDICQDFQIKEGE
jgi:hypothetical protein